MSRALMEQCLNDRDIVCSVKYHARRIQRNRPYLFDIEDAIQSLWEAIFKELPKYDGSKSLKDFARSIAYSRSGNLTAHCKHNAEYRNEYAIRPDTFGYSEGEDSMDGWNIIGRVDPTFDVIDAQITLDTIEKRLIRESEKSKQFKVILKSFRLMRLGMPQTDVADRLNLDRRYIGLLYSRLRKSDVLSIYRE